MQQLPGPVLASIPRIMSIAKAAGSYGEQQQQQHGVNDTNYGIA